MFVFFKSHMESREFHRRAVYCPTVISRALFSYFFLVALSTIGFSSVKILASFSSPRQVPAGSCRFM